MPGWVLGDVPGRVGRLRRWCGWVGLCAQGSLGWEAAQWNGGQWNGRYMALSHGLQVLHERLARGPRDITCEVGACGLRRAPVPVSGCGVGSLAQQYQPCV